MRGRPEEEIGKGTLDKYKALKLIHELMTPKSYLEIGVKKGTSFALADCVSVGVDPHTNISSKKNSKIYKMRSDDFFKNNKFKPDLAFIDGNHLFESVLRDFINVEKNSHKDTVVLIDDVFPAHPAQALRKRRTQKWCGDVWKILPTLESCRPDLHIYYLDVSPTGMILIKNLNKTNPFLSDHYSMSLENFKKDQEPPEEIINRESITESPEKVIERIFNA